MNDSTKPNIIFILADDMDMVIHPERVSSMAKTWDVWFEEVTAAWSQLFRDNLAGRADVDVSCERFC